MLELWYFTWIFPVIRPFRGNHYFFLCDLGVDPFFLNFNFVNNLNSECLSFYISHEYFLWSDISMGTIIFVLVTFTLEFDPFFENLNLADNFRKVSARSLIFHISIHCDKTFPWFHYFLINIKAFILRMSISCDGGTNTSCSKLYLNYLVFIKGRKNVQIDKD